MRYANATLPSPRPSLWRYCLAAWPAALVPSMLLLASAYAVFALLGMDVEPPDFAESGLSTIDYFGIVVFSPVVETAVLIVVLKLLLALRLPRLPAAAVSAVAWGLVHASVELLWFFGTVWSFFVFSYAYVSWRPVSFKHAFLAAGIPHALVNATALLLLLAAEAAEAGCGG